MKINNHSLDNIIYRSVFNKVIENENQQSLFQ